MKATKPIKAGDEIFNDYGPLPRSDLLRMYGYITENYAQYDVVEFKHDLFVDVAGMKTGRNKSWLKREEQLLELGIVDDGYSLQRPPKDAELEACLPGNMHMLLRGLCLDENTNKVPKMNYQKSISVQEASLLSSVATKRLSEYRTSLNDDRRLLQEMQDPNLDDLVNGKFGKGTFSRHLMALQVIIGEKEILHSIIDMCQRHIKKQTDDLANPNKRKLEDNNTTKTNKSKKRCI
jgi:N-lysine methyltransferase SETD6